MPTLRPPLPIGHRAGRRLVTVLIALAAVAPGCARPAVDAVPLPSFDQERTVSAETAGWNGVAPDSLPADCAAVMSADELTALLGRPIGSVALRTVRGVAEPSVARTARLSCRYSDTERAGTPVLALNVGRYESAAAAARQWKLNSDAERADANSRDIAVGAARAVLVERPDTTALILTWSDSTITLVLPTAVTTTGGAAGALVDLALRVIPRVVLEGEPATGDERGPTAVRIRTALDLPASGAAREAASDRTDRGDGRR